MAEKDYLGNPEFDALKDIEGVDPDKFMAAARGEDINEPGDPPAPKPGSGDPPPEPQPGSGDPPPEPPKKDEPPAPQPQDAFLKEIFGDRFKTVDEAKQANISGVLDEVESLRQTKADLESKLESKPKTNFANDEVALFNEFVRETGVRNYKVFEKLNGADMANMDPMEALVIKHILDHPELASREDLVRKRFEKKYNLDPNEVEEETLELNKLEVEADGATAIRALQELKGKLKVPEPTPDDKPKELSPEERSKLQTGWSNVGQEIGKALTKLKIPIKDRKDALLDYEISESDQKDIRDFVANYAVENQMEPNETNMRMISHMVYNQLMINKLPEIVHSVFEKARNMTEEEVHKMYENPSPSRNNDAPPAPPSPDNRTDKEKLQDDIFDAEMDQYNK